MTLLVFTALACGGIIDVSVNRPFAIDLEENATTGYRWQFEADPGLEIVSSSYTVGEGGGVGGGGMRRLMLRSEVQGERGLHGKLLRSWLGESSAIKRCDITVRVR